MWMVCQEPGRAPSGPAGAGLCFCASQELLSAFPARSRSSSTLDVCIPLNQAAPFWAARSPGSVLPPPACGPGCERTHLTLNSPGNSSVQAVLWAWSCTPARRQHSTHQAHMHGDQGAFARPSRSQSGGGGRCTETK